MNIGKGIRMLLEKKGMNQKQLAMETNLSQTTISQLMSSETMPRKETLEAIAKVFGVKPEFILFLSFGRDDVPKEKRQFYDLIWPQTEAMIIKLFTDEK